MSYASVCAADGGSLISLGSDTSPAGNANGVTFPGTTDPSTGLPLGLIDTGYTPTSGQVFSLEMFVKPPSGSSNTNLLNAGNGVTSGFACLTDAWFVQNLSVGMQASFLPGQWNHLIIACSASVIDAYCNGVWVGRLGSTGYIAASIPLSIQIGGSGFTGARSSSPWQGSVSEFRTYASALSIAQAVRHYAARFTSSAPAPPSPGVSPYYDAVIADTPAFLYRLDDNYGSSELLDRTTNGNNGATIGNPDGYLFGATPGPLGNDPDVAMVFVPSQLDQDGFAGIATPVTAFGVGGAFSYECWINLAAIPPSSSPLFQAWRPFVIASDGPSNGGPWVGINNLGQLQTSFTTYGIGGIPLSLNVWHYVVLTFDGANWVLYLDSVAVASGTGSVSIPVGANLLINVNQSNSGLSGSFALGNAAFYNYALSPTKVTTHWNDSLASPPSPPTFSIANDDNHYYEVRVYDSAGTLVDIPHAEIEAITLNDILNGGSSDGTIEFRSPFNATPPAGFLFRVLIWIWHGRIARPLNPWWAGYMLEPDQEKLTNDGHTTWHLLGDQGLLNRGLVIEDINPGVGGNPQLDAADYLRHLTGSNGYADPAFGRFVIPVQMFPLQPMQFQQVLLGSVIDQVIKSGRSAYGVMWIWRVDCDYLLNRTFTTQPDQNPNAVPTASFRHIFVDDECAVYKISTVFDQIINVILVTGGTDPTTGYPAVGVFEDTASISEFGGWEQAVSVPGLLSQAACEAYGEAYLDMYANAQANGTIELFNPDPSIKSGQWIQTWEQSNAGAPIIKQWRVGGMNVKITPSKITMQLSPVAPTPYLDEAVYRVGLAAQNVASAAVSNINVLAPQTQFVLQGATVTH